MGSFRLSFLCFGITILFGGAVMYYLEENPATGDHLFTSIPGSLWWCVQTLTTVGYGDLIPITVAGRLFAFTFMLIGATTTCLPLLAIIEGFVTLYPRNIKMVSGDNNVGGTSNEGIQIPDHLQRT